MAKADNPEEKGARGAFGLDDIFSKLKQDAQPQEKAAAPAPAQKKSLFKEDRGSLKKFRENLMTYDWARDEVYRISVKFFGKRTADELNAQFEKLLASMHYLTDLKENSDLAVKVLLDEMTSV